MAFTPSPAVPLRRTRAAPAASPSLLRPSHRPARASPRPRSVVRPASLQPQPQPPQQAPNLPLPTDKIAAGVVFNRARLSAADQNWALWEQLGLELAAALGPHEATVERIYFYYLPVFFWIHKLLQARADAPPAPVLVGVSCPQGGGKTTLTKFMKSLFAFVNKTCVVASTDDFYLTRAQQQDLAAKTHAGNPLLEFRGNPGTVDLALAMDTIERLQRLPAGDVAAVPKYNKSAFAGLGDRHAEADFSTVQGPVDVILLEGWCMGFRPVPNDALIDPNLGPVNDYLRDFEDVYQRLDALLVVEVEDASMVYRWRQEAEDQMRASGRDGMSEEQLKDFVDRFMPSYKQYLPGLYAQPVIGGPELRIRISPTRTPGIYTEL